MALTDKALFSIATLADLKKLEITGSRNEMVLR